MKASVCYTGQRQSWIKHRFVLSIQKQYYKHHIAQEKDVQILLVFRYEVPFLGLSTRIHHSFLTSLGRQKRDMPLVFWVLEEGFLWAMPLEGACLLAGGERATVSSNSHAGKPSKGARFESMSFIANILACKLKIVNNRN